MSTSAEKEIWVLGDLRNERFFGFSLNLLAKARELAEQVSGKAAMVLMGLSADDDELKNTPISQAFIPVSEAEKSSLAHGADKVYIFDIKGLSVPRADIFEHVLANAVLKHRPMLVLFALTDFGRELAARTATVCNCGLIADCLDLRIEKGGVVTTSPSWGGEIMAEITFSNSHTTGFATVQPHVHRAQEVPGKAGVVERMRVDCPDAANRIKLLSSEVEPAEHRKLEEANVVVVGGAGLGSMEDFGLVRELAAAMGGEVGATRPPVLQHWVEEKRLIGQTGKAVRPGILLSVGTSGAVQYTAGITEAKTIVAINRDQNSPIFQIADLGVVTDAKTFLPMLTTKLKQVVMRKMADVLCEEKGAEPGEGFGAKVCKLREDHDWSVEDMAGATGQTPEFIEQIENEEFSPSVSFLLSLAKALNVDPSTFLRKEEKEIIRGQRSKAFTKRTRIYSYQTLTPGAESNHLRAFIVTIESRQAHKPVEYKHEGEEFIYVMEGELEVNLGSKNHHLKTGESIHFNSDIPHKLKSLSNQDTRCLVVLYTV
ncbi:MAG: FAD-binding protein [Desulfobacterales bacterium]|jgi:electron transfer flavoprotein alpha subunit/transcriptional regulator with XRE-family HTH domain